MTDRLVTSARLAEYPVRVVRGVRVPTAQDHVTLAADLYLPEGAEPAPALVTVVPYRRDALAGMNYQGAMRWFAERGYACILADLGGTGSSDGPFRAPFDTTDADDGVAVVTWAARQVWCDGRVGMWGLSYAATVALRTASRQPSPLRAVLPVMPTVDPERDWVHPGGARGGLAAGATWGAHTLKLQLLPPLWDHHSAEEQRRWRRRLESTPYLVDMYRHGPGHPTWRDRAVRVSDIVTPALCVGGWRDVFCEATVEVFEQLRGPKKLLIGPWTHTFPHRSPHGAVDFLAVALRWWDGWLRGQQDAGADDPDVVLYTQGERPCWRGFEGWPVPTVDRAMTTGDDSRLEEGVRSGDGTAVIAGYRPDPTAGVLSGLWFTGLAGQGTPLDQHDDDCRAASFTSGPLVEELTIIGRPEVDLVLAPPGVLEPALSRIVVRVADVDPQDRSTYIAGGLLSRVESGTRHRVTLAPTAYRVAAGHRLRVVVGDADFPRLWPAVGSPELQVAAVCLRPAAVALDNVTDVDLPTPALDGIAAPTVWEDLRWSITRSPVSDGVEVAIDRDSVASPPAGGHLLESHQESRAGVQRGCAASAEMTVNDRLQVRWGGGRSVQVVASTRVTSTELWARGEVTVDGRSVYTRTWEVTARGGH